MRRYRPARFSPGEVIDLRLSYDRMPGRFARYVVGIFLAAQRNEHLVAEHPQLTGAIREADCERPPMPCSIAPTRLFLALANRNVVLTCDTVMTASFRPSGSTPAGLVVPPAIGPTGFMQLAVYSPFAFTLVLEGNPPPGAGIEISKWTTYEHHQRIGRRDRRLAVPIYTHPLLPE